MSDSPASKDVTSSSTANSRTPGASGAAGAPASSGGGHELKRVMGPGLLLLFIVGDILGTGVYALTGNIAGEIGGAAWAPILIAFVVATITAFSYLELVTKYPGASGAALYTHKAFGIHFLTFLVTFAVLCSGLTSAATASSTVASNFAKGFHLDVGPLGITIVAVAFLAILALVNLRGVSESVKLNVVLTCIELTGLLIVILVGFWAAAQGSADFSRTVIFETSDDKGMFLALTAVTSLAFFSFVGFEDSVNMVEETENPRQVFPRIMLTGLGIAVLVVAADDGVMPQTVEALNHAQAANVPIVVAVNKVDKPDANPEKIRGQLTEYGLVPEEYGGDTMFVDVSARENLHIDDLLDAIVLTADGALELQANPDKNARGVAIEANLDKGRGAVCTVLVQSGTLTVGDSIVAGAAYGRVRAMFDEMGRTVEAALPSRPVQVLGLSSVPRAGDTFLATQEERTARQIAEKREAADRNAQLAKRRKRITLESFDEAVAEGKIDTLNLIIKGDVSGAVEALEDSLLKIDVGEEVQLRVIHRGVGAITQNDVNLATVDNAVIIGFNVRPAERVTDLAEREGVEMKFYSVIYNAIDDVESALKGMLKPEYEEVELGTAEIREVFRSSKWGNIAGAYITKGVVRRNGKARLVRDGNVVQDNLTIDSLRRFKDDATEVREGYECGIGLGSFNDIREGDLIETWEMREKPRD